MARAKYSIPGGAVKLQLAKDNENYNPDRLNLKTPLFSKATTGRWRRQTGRFTNQPKPLTFPIQQAGFFDAFTIMSVLDCLLRLEPTTWISANNLCVILNREYDYIAWRPQVVGRILGELQGIAKEINGHPLPHDDPDRVVPVVGTGINGARFWGLSPDAVSYNWLGALRDWAGYMAEHASRTGRDKKEPPRYGQLIWEFLWQTPWGAQPDVTRRAIDTWRNLHSLQPEVPQGEAGALYYCTKSSMKDE